MSMTRRLACAVAASIAALTLVAPVHADSYPSRPIRLLVPWPPGTPGDVVGRVLAERMGAALQQTVVVENKPGASGTIGLSDALRQPADGYTLYMLASPGTLVAPLLLPTTNVDLQRSLAPVGLVAWSYNVLVTSTTSPFKSARDIVAAGKAKPGSLSYASGGNGTPAHLAGALFAEQTRTEFVHVPYQQFPMAITDVLTGRVDFMFLTSAAAIPQIAGGKMRPLGTTGAKRLAALPNVPAMTEQEFPDFVIRGFEMLTVKSGTPPEVIAKLNAALNDAVKSRDVKEKLDGLGLEVDPMTPTQARSTLDSEQARLLKFGRSIGLKAD
jgi:tripartite-type tricarboxylate transporter receptor subunit TctC